MDLFSSPSWDDGDACEKINKKLLGYGTETSVSASNKKSRKAAKKMAKSEKTQLSAPSQQGQNTSTASNHVDLLKKDLLSELKCKFAKKRKHPATDTEKEISSPSPIKKKKVTFSNEAEVVLIDASKPVHVSPKKKKKSSKPTNDDLESVVLNQPSGKFNLSSLLGKLSKKIDKLDKKELEKKEKKGNIDANDPNADHSSSKTPSSVNGKMKIKKKKKGVPALPDQDVVSSDPTPSEKISTSLNTKKLKKNKKKPTATNASVAEENNDVLVTKSSKMSDQIKLSRKAKKKLKKERKKLKCNSTALKVKSVELRPIAETSVPSAGSSPTRFSNSSQLKLKQSLAEHDQSPSPSPEKQSEQKIAVRRAPGTLRERMMRKLHASRFRYLNEQMYLSKGNESLEYFKTDPQAFQAYHQGYRQQVEQWPLNPLDKIINMLRKKPALVVADFGCGDARLARSIPNKVHSFDLVALSDLVTPCDMAHTPLGNAVVDVAVFCLSLMGTNLEDYLKEANRVLKEGGSLKIAEVESRFEDVDAFIKNVQKYGFDFVNKDLSNELFYFMDFHKVGNISSKKAKKSALPEVRLKPCYYKKR